MFGDNTYLIDNRNSLFPWQAMGTVIGGCDFAAEESAITTTVFRSSLIVETNYLLQWWYIRV